MEWRDINIDVLPEFQLVICICGYDIEI